MWGPSQAVTCMLVNPSGGLPIHEWTSQSISGPA